MNIIYAILRCLDIQKYPVSGTVRLDLFFYVFSQYRRLEGRAKRTIADSWLRRDVLYDKKTTLSVFMNVNV